MGWWSNDDNGGPTLYTVPNRTAVTGDVSCIAACLTFVTLYIAFLIIFPGVRKERLTTFTTVTLSLFVGNVIMVCRMGSSWHVANTKILSPYRAFSKELLAAELGAYIGLAHINITLLGDNNTDIDFNERFTWRGSGEMGESYKAGLERGLPFPILTVAEYLTLGQEGFTWGGNYRHAGYYASIFLWAAFACWLLMNLLLVVVPRYGACAMSLTGTLMLGSAFAYHCLLPVNPLKVRFEHSMLSFKFGWCFWLVVVAGALCFFAGAVIIIIDLIYPNRFSTILEVDYDTPYDRHVIIEESHYKRRTGKGLEEPPGLGRRILRRLSSKKEERNLEGQNNAGFEMDVPKSPWNYPLHRPALHAAFRRQDSASSAASSINSPPVGYPFQSFRQPSSSEKPKEVVMW
ncbi:dual oxidase maturation factor 2 [Cimex lectularius]|uniref:Dual oxidase maturation factor 1 n=1 Tax=Cimex lectularius TaxID=79782 RepID=A0A8I6RAJ2_CIMLE|nr:dual oxidase maturation factor 2 [Cimex lectularius]XP_014242290.1 dual oxidase maturation factor 2 [Cimex lectularius]XP_024081463.1 dual oxidase maturation factor 2 [Cimex lectularius]